MRWVHKKCSGVKGSLHKVSDTDRYVHSVAECVRSRVDVGGGSGIVLVDKFCI